MRSRRGRRSGSGRPKTDTFVELHRPRKMPRRMTGPKPQVVTQLRSERVARSPQQLPRGQHGLTREHVTQLQRSRMLRAMAEAMAERGYVDTSVADVLNRA